MMQTLISGQAGLAILVRGNIASVITADAPGKTVEYPLSAVPLLLCDATDVVQHASISMKETLAELTCATESDRALHLALIVLDVEEDPETREIAAEDLEDGLADAAVNEWVANRLSAAPLPACVDLQGLRDIVQRRELVARLVRQIGELQPAIRRYWQAWQDLPPSSFEGGARKEDFESVLTDLGALRLLASAGEDPTQFGMARYSCYQALAGLPGSRQVLDAWLRGLVPARPAGTVRQPPNPAESTKFHQDGDAASGRSHMTPHEVFENVTRQKDAIVQAIRKSDARKVHKYTRELVQFQLGHGDSEFAAMSLCDLAQEAKRVRAHSLQLELAMWAARVAPSDSWTSGQVADAYCCLQRYDEAMRWLDRTASLGNIAFACMGRARVLREQGRLQKALSQFETARLEHPSEVPAWIGLAEVQRELLLLDDALATYEAAATRFPDNTIPSCGRAAVLKQLGRVDEALAAYHQIMLAHPDCVVAANGRAEVLREMGRYEDALAAYDEAIERFPNDSVARCGQSQVLKEMGRLDDALRAYEKATGDFEYEPVPWNGRAEVYREMGRLVDALHSYDEAVRRFPEDVRTLSSRANVLKEQGKLQEALQAYDQIIAAFPHDVFARSARAHLLKQLGRLPEALAAYDRVIDRTPHDQSARHAKAAVLVALGRYADAQRLLPVEQPRTRDEWIGYHVRGMILLKTGEYAKAVAHFETGLASVPFASERKYFRNALAVAATRARKLHEAASYLGRDSDPMTDVLRVHIYGALRNHDEAMRAYERLAATCPPILCDLRDELAARYSFKQARPRFDWAWVFEQECRGILLAAA